MNEPGAKELFRRFRGNYFHMQREGLYELYKTFNIPEAQERKWAKEIESDLIMTISLEGDEVCAESFLTDLSSMLSVYRDVEEFANLLDVLREKHVRLDSFTVMRSCEEVLNIIDEFQRKNVGQDVCIKAKYFVINTLKDLLGSPIHVSQKYYNIEYLKDALKEEKLVARINRDLERCNTVM